MSTKIVPSVTLKHCPRCAGFLVQDVLFDGQGWSNFSVQVQRCLMCQRIFEGEREYGREVGTLEDIQYRPVAVVDGMIQVEITASEYSEMME